MSEFGFWIFITMVVVLFAGEPDLHDVIMGRFAGECVQTDGDGEQ